jgi:UDP-N-acetylglucosamine--N-acetylmuramyl-(pentapeptide) pyrophosphoryl-undecaprenol N-acetylglucosamine transferase
MTPSVAPSITIACGGTGGHLFPGLAVAGQFARRGAEVTLLISPKDVDQQAVRTARNLEIITLPAVGLSRGRALTFLRGLIRSYRALSRRFQLRPPHAVLAMGGFTGPPAILAGRKASARTFLHESNTVPGRANRWLARVVDRVFLGFPQAANRLPGGRVTVTGTPVRPQFHPRDPLVCRVALGLEPSRPVLLVTGGSQGASGINQLVLRAMPLLAQSVPALQWFHLAGPVDAENVRAAAAELGVKAEVHGFFTEMDLALGAAAVAISRAGASSLAELAAMRVPAVLIPYPSATDQHQLANARAFAETGAAQLLEAPGATPEGVARLIRNLLEDAAARASMQAALAKWDAPHAAEQIADEILGVILRSADRTVPEGFLAREVHEPIPPAPGATERQKVSVA